MKKVTILAILAVLIAVFAYFSLFSDSNDLSGTSDGPRPAQTLDGSTVVSNDPLKGSGTLEELRQMGEDLECSISYYDDEQQTGVEGMYFVSDGNMRGDFVTETPDLTGEVVSSMIFTGDMMYIWSEIDGQTYGVKMDTSLFADAAIETNEPVGLDAMVTYDCKSWQKVDESVFVPPGDVLFQDMSEIMRAGMENPTLYEEGEFFVQ